MKILCVVPSYWPAFEFGGPIFSVHALNRALRERGVEVSVYTTNVGLGDTVDVDKEVDVDGVGVTYFSYSKLFEFFGTTGWQFSLPLTKALKAHIPDFDLVYIVGIWNYPVAAAAHYSRVHNKPYIISPRGHLYPFATSFKPWKKLPYFNLISKRDLNGAAAIHYTTADEAESCQEYLNLDAEPIVFPNGIDAEPFKKSDKNLKISMPWLEDKRVILSLGRISIKKGFDTIVPMFGMLTKKFDDLHLLIVGNDEDGYKRQVKTMLKTFDLGYVDLSDDGNSDSSVDSSDYKNIKATFTGLLTGPDKVAAYKSSDFFVLPSYTENFGMTVVEAMASGVPVLISNEVGIYREIKEAKAGVVVDAEPEAFYKKLKLLLKNDGRCRLLSKKGEKLVADKFSIDRVAEMAIEAFEGLV